MAYETLARNHFCKALTEARRYNGGNAKENELGNTSIKVSTSVPEDSLPVELPSKPPLVTRITNAKDLNDMGRAISEYPNLAKEVLTIINAPYFTLMRETKSVEEAVRFLSMNRVANFTRSRLLYQLIFQGISPKRKCPLWPKLKCPLLIAGGDVTEEFITLSHQELDRLCIIQTTIAKKHSHRRQLCG